MRVLVACEWSGVVRNAFLRRGHDAYSCDIYPGRNPTYGRHLRQDVTPLLLEPWDLVIAHPPCTYLCNSGVSRLKHDPSRHHNLLLGAQFFIKCLMANAPKVCVENPLMHPYAMELVGESYKQIIHPYYFGEPFVKQTCLWLQGLRKLKATHILDNYSSRVMSTGGKFKSISRSITYEGIAEAMASQWG